MRKLLKIAAYALGGILVFLLLLAVVTQTQFFRDRLRTAALSNLNSLLDADVHLGELRGNLVTGFSIDSIAIMVRDSPLLVAERLDLRYNLLEMAGRKISVNAVTLVRPIITLRRLQNGRWNFDQMVRQSAPDTVPSRPFDWVVRLDQLELREGILTLLDSIGLQDPEHRPAESNRVDYHHIALRDLNLVLSVDIQANAKTVGITSLAFRSDNPAFLLKRFAGVFTVTPTEARVSNLVVTTARSKLQLNASIGKLDVLHGLRLEDLRQCPIAVDLKANDVDLDELKMFLPPLGFLNGPVNVDLVAGGEFGDLQMQRLEVRFGHTEMRMKGSVLNLHEPHHLLLDVKIAESSVSPGDPLALMPSFNLPDLSRLGMIRLAMEYQGSPLDFRARGTVESDAGSFESDVSLAIGGPTMLQYKGLVGFHDVNLASVLNDTTMESALSGNLRIGGEGVSLAGLKSSLSIDIDSSMFRDQQLRNTRITLAGSEHSLNGTANVHLGAMTSTLSMDMRGMEGRLPTFTVEGVVRSLHLGSFLRDSQNGASVSFTVHAKGRGVTVGTVGGEVDLDYSYVTQGDTTETSGGAHLLVDQSDTLHKTFSFESTLGSVSLTGAYELRSILWLLTFHANNLSAAVRERFAFMDSSSTNRGVPSRVRSAPAEKVALPGSLHAEYLIRIDDLEPLTMFLPRWDGFGQAECTGKIIGTSSETSVEGRLTIGEFAYGRVEGGTLIEGCEVDFNFQHLKASDPLKDLTVDIRGSSEAIHINQNELDSLQVDVSYAANNAAFSARSKVKGDLAVFGRGTATLAQDTVAVRFDTLRASFEDYSWRSDPGALVKIWRGGLSVNDVVMRRDSQQVRLDAALGSGGSLSGLLIGTQLDLGALSYLLSEEERSRMGEVFSGVTGVQVRASGTVDNPEFAANLQARDITYRTVPFGTLTGAFAYKERMLGIQLSVDEPAKRTTRSPELVIAGSIPVDLGLHAVRERFPDEPMDLTVRSDRLEIGILDPLLPTFDQLKGMLNCDVSVKGTPGHPQYGGSMTVKECSFVFVPNNIAYLFDGTFLPEGERIRVVDATLRNVPSDESVGQTGSIRIGGDFSITDLKPGDFNLSATGSVLVVKETTRKSSLSVYGRLFVEIGSGGLHFTGSMDESLLKGDLLIRNSTLIFPPTRSSSQEQAELSVPIVAIDDTARTGDDLSHSAVARYFGVANERRNESIHHATLPTKSFLDGVRYDLDIETSGRTSEIRMIFNPVTSEELVAAIDGKFSITDDGKKWFGELTVDRASYYFFKRFVAEGKINFTGDFLNPGLDIQATYEGTRKVRDSVATGMETTEKVVVTIKITGTRYEPKLGMFMKIADYEYALYPGLTSNDVQSDAIQFILYGSFPLTVSQKNDVANDVRSTVGTSLLTSATSLLTGTLSDFLRLQTGFISSVELSYGSGDNLGQRADIRLSGVAFNGLWRYGGKILNDPLSNANFSLLYSFGTIFNDASLRNFMLELERKVQDIPTGQTSTPKGVNSARLFYRFSF